MPTAYLSPSQLQDLTNVSSTAPVSGDNGKALVWNQAAGRWQAEQVAYSNLSGAPTLPIPVVSGGTGTQTGSITGTGSLTFASASNGNVTLSPHGTGKTVIDNELDINLRSQNGLTTGVNINLPLGQANPGNGLFLKKGNSYFSVSNVATQPNDFVIIFQGKIDVNQGDKDQCMVFDSLYPNTATPTAGITSFWVRDSLAADLNNTLLPDNKMCFAFWNSISGYGQANPAGLLFRILGSGNANLKGNLVIRGTEASTSTTTGALQVAGGIGAQGNLIVGGTRINFANLPTSSTGLAVGDLWRDGDVVKVKL
jgi:hypothetical protein